MMLDANQVVKVACSDILVLPLRRDRLRQNAPQPMTTPALSAPPLLILRRSALIMTAGHCFGNLFSHLFPGDG